MSREVYKTRSGLRTHRDYQADRNDPKREAYKLALKKEN